MDIVVPVKKPDPDSKLEIRMFCKKTVEQLPVKTDTKSSPFFYPESNAVISV
jgi:hypothetical protein